MKDASRRKILRILVTSGFGTAALPSMAYPEKTNCSEKMLIDAKISVQEGWQRQRFVGETVYRNTVVDNVEAIHAKANNSASGLIRKLDFEPHQFPHIDWQWRVEALQSSADIRYKETEDFAAVIFFLFGEPEFLYSGIRSLGYVWTTDSVAADTVVHSARRPTQSRYLVLQSGRQKVGQWVKEQRNLLDDFERVYGENAPEIVSGISIFVDNDQTGQAVESMFSNLYARCDSARSNDN